MRFHERGLIVDSRNIIYPSTYARAAGARKIRGLNRPNSSPRVAARGRRSFVPDSASDRYVRSLRCECDDNRDDEFRRIEN